ncbi:MAG: hypothetical protein ACLT3Y_07650 [Ruminococcus callidus]
MFARQSFLIPVNDIPGLTSETRPAESLVSLAVRLGLANAFVCLFCMCCVDIPGVCFGDGFCFDTAFAALVFFAFLCEIDTRRCSSFFFTKKKKEAKKKDLAYPCSERQCMPRLAVW